MTDDSFYWSILIVRCQVGDRGAFEELLRHCQPRLRSFLHKMLANRCDADDLAQEVWMDVFRDICRLRNPAAFLTWFYRIARNRVFRALRHDMHLRLPEDAQQDIQINEPAEFSAEDVQAVHAAIDRLSPEHREVLLLRFIEDMTYDDIASVVGCQIGTVRSRIHHAKRSLRQIIERGYAT